MSVHVSSAVSDCSLNLKSSIRLVLRRFQYTLQMSATTFTMARLVGLWAKLAQPNRATWAWEGRSWREESLERRGLGLEGGSEGSGPTGALGNQINQANTTNKTNQAWDERSGER